VIDLDGDYAVSVGSKYRINHGDEELTTGVFKGYSAMGTETMMVFQLDDGTLRFINLAQIIYLDLLEGASKKPSKKKDAGSVYYG
jgi:hypothetical protein